MTTGAPIGVADRARRVHAVSHLLAEIGEWGWDEAPSRRLLFRSDIPRLPRPLPRYLPPDADRRLGEALAASSSCLAADALLLARVRGLRIGELLDLELDCVHEVPAQGSWLKVPLGKLDTERMVPLDEESVELLDRIVITRSPGRPIPHPRTGRPADFLFTHHGRRLSQTALREELARAAGVAGIGHVTPHALRHTYATALVNAGVSHQALMALMGHVSTAMSLRYGHLFDSTVRAEYERALGLAKGRLGTHPDRAHQAAAPGRRRLAAVPGHQDGARGRLLHPGTGPGRLPLRQHLRALPGLPHRHRQPARAGRPAARRGGAGGRRRIPRLGRRGRPAPQPHRPARRAHHRGRGGMTADDLPTRVETALAHLVAADRPITFTAVAEVAGTARATLYRNAALRALVDEHRARQIDTRTLSGLHAEIAHLRAALEVVAARVTAHEERLRRLEGRRAAESA